MEPKGPYREEDELRRLRSLCCVDVEGDVCVVLFVDATRPLGAVCVTLLAFSACVCVE